MLACLLALAQVPAASPEPELERLLGFELAEFAPAARSIPAEGRRAIADRLARPRAFFDTLALFTGRGQGPAARAPESLVLARLLLDEPLGGARLCLAVGADGRLAHAAVGGRPEFDQDPESSWGLFLGQMCRYGSLGPDDELVLRGRPGHDAREMDAYLAGIAGADADAELVGALVEQRHLMRSFTLLERRLLSIPERSPPEAWLGEASARFSRLTVLSPRLEPVLGARGASEHARLGREASEYFRQLREAALAGQDYAATAKRVRGLCGRCHDEPNDDGVSWEDAGEAVRRELSLPSGALRVGYDVAAAWGDDGRTSQHLADAVRGTLLLIEDAEKR